MHLLIASQDDEPWLLEELQRAFPGGRHDSLGRRLVAGRAQIRSPEPLPPLAFCRQMLPDAQSLAAASIRIWSELMLEAIRRQLPKDKPWRLHVLAHYGSGRAGLHRCDLIQRQLVELMQRKARRLLACLETGHAGWTADHSLVQLLLTGPDTGFWSAAPAPLPFVQRHLVSPFPKGEIEVDRDLSAPSRAFAKLVEAQQRLGRWISANQTCVDLGASPGSWSYVALQRGARVVAVDRAPLRADLMRHPRLRFRQGDAFAYAPERPADWLLCDVIAAPDRSIRLLCHWLENRLARNFVVTVKFKGTADYAKLEELKRKLPSLCEHFYLNRLCANRNEVCAFGATRQ